MLNFINASIKDYIMHINITHDRNALMAHIYVLHMGDQWRTNDCKKFGRTM